jgi:hypothetical protein
MPRQTNRELLDENDELRTQLESIHSQIEELLDTDDDSDDESESDDEE